MAAKLSPAMIEMIRDAALHTNGILRGNTRTQEALIKRGLAEDIRNGSGIVHVYLTQAGRDAARLHVPGGILPGDVSQADTVAEVAEQAAAEHFANATSDDANRSFCLSPTYQASQQALRDAIVAAYPAVDAERVYDVWVDCNESIAYCVNAVREQAIEDAADAARMAAEDAADAAHDAEVDAARLGVSVHYRRFLTGRRDTPRTALALAHAHATLDITLTPQDGDELNEFTYTLPTEVYGVAVERTVRAVFGDVNVYDDGILLCGVARHFTDAGARRAVAVLARRILPDVMAEVDAMEDARADMEDARNTLPTVLPTFDRQILLSQPGYTEWSRTIRGVDYWFNMSAQGDGTWQMRAFREMWIDGDCADREPLHRFTVGTVTPVPLVGPRGEVTRRVEDNGAILWWERTIGNQRYRFVLGTNTTNGAVVVTVTTLGTDMPIRVIQFRKPVTVAPSVSPGATVVTVGRVTQPPVVTLPPRTVASGMRSVPRKGRGRRSSGWRKAGKR